MLADAGGLFRFFLSFVPGLLVGITALAIIWLIAYAVTSLRGPRGGRRPPRRHGF